MFLALPEGCDPSTYSLLEMAAEDVLYFWACDDEVEEFAFHVPGTLGF